MAKPARALAARRSSTDTHPPGWRVKPRASGAWRRCFARNLLTVTSLRSILASFSGLRNQPLHHHPQQLLHAHPIRLDFVRPGHALEGRVVEPEDEVVQVTPVFRAVHVVNAIDRLDLLEPARIDDSLRSVGFESFAVERVALEYFVIRCSEPCRNVTVEFNQAQGVRPFVSRTLAGDVASIPGRVRL